MSGHINVRNLLHLPFEHGVTDCHALARAVLRRGGREDAALVLDSNPNTASELLELIESGDLPRWEVVGTDVSAATELCDIIVGERGEALHVAILTSTRPRLALTAVLDSHSRQIHPEWFRDCSLVLRPTPLALS